MKRIKSAYTHLRFPVLAAFTITVLLTSCKKKDDDTDEPIVYDPAVAYTINNVSYGNDNQQVMDVYLPANRNSAETKVFVLIHGGGWSAGDKSDFNDLFNNLKSLYPDHAIINLNYRLATASSPGYPKQIDDIQAALDHIQLPGFDVSKQYFLIGGSAGAHLSLLYGYAFDPSGYVKGICNIVGPADFTDPAYTNDAYLMSILASFTGTTDYNQNQALFEEVSPAKRVTSSSPKTISFYGDADPLIPSSQMGLLHDALTANGVYNESTMYAGEGHGGWNQTNSADCVTKMVNFINQHF